MSELGTNPLAAGEKNISVDAARAAMRAAVVPIRESEVVSLADAFGRVLAADVISPINVPANDNSAMDGYAFDGAALRPDRELTLRAVGRVVAGQPPIANVRAGECVRIMTGAVMPGGLDTVVPLELCRVDGDQVVIEPGVIHPRENLRKAGEDLARGRPALLAGRVLRPADIGLIASLGLVQAEVLRRATVAVFSTGDEVVAPGQPLPANCIYDSNRFALIAAVERLGMKALDFGLLRDDPAALRGALEQALDRVDAIVISGGASAGDADYTRDVMARLGSVEFWKIAMRPGRPFAFGFLRGRNERRVWLFALPGNPVAALVTFYVLAREALLALAGASAEAFPAAQARSVAAIRKRPGRTEFQRGIVSRATDGMLEVRTVGSQGAGVLRSMTEANALIVLGHDQGSVAAGQPVDVWLFEGLT
ncbi:MAG TPA: gephyrin-like molybdotransferase Glp [Burkholderiaceae bacterium]|nr:gephyrin-like molybdotransferase Glp [Burkholderiaceae bacterium]